MKKIFKVGLSAVFLLLGLNNVSTAAEVCPQINDYGTVVSNQQYVNVCRAGYSLAYNTKTKTPAWVAEKLTRDNLETKNASRTDDFRPDPQIPSQYSASLSDYRGSGFDRGHMAPAEDFRGFPEEMSESFYLSNMIPQNSNLNRGTWASLEKNMRYWAQKYGVIYVTTGPIYYKGKSLGYAGTVPVPTHLFKAVYIPKLNETIAFILPNQPVNNGQLPKSISTVKNLELLTGFQFYPKVSESIKEKTPTDLVIFNR